MSGEKQLKSVAGLHLAAIFIFVMLLSLDYLDELISNDHLSHFL